MYEFGNTTVRLIVPFLTPILQTEISVITFRSYLHHPGCLQQSVHLSARVRNTCHFCCCRFSSYRLAPDYGWPSRFENPVRIVCLLSCRIQNNMKHSQLHCLKIRKYKLNFPQRNAYLTLIFRERVVALLGSFDSKYI